MGKVLLVAAILISQFAFSQSQYRFHHYSKTDGLANDYNYCIEQDSLGFIWAFYPGAMSRFDGYNFKIYKYVPDDTLRSGLNFSMEWPVKDHNHNLWFTKHAHPQSELYILMSHNRKTDGFIKYEIDLGGARPVPRSPLFEKDGSLVWIGTNDKGLFSYNLKTGETANYLNYGADGKPQRPYSIYRLKDLGNSLLLATGFGLWIFDKETKSYTRPQCRPEDSTLLYPNPAALYRESPNIKENFTWLQSGKNLMKIDSSFHVVQKFEIPEEIDMWDIHASRDSDGVFWFPGRYNSNSGLFRFDPRDSSLTNLKHDPGDPQSIASDYVVDVVVDTDQNVWLATDRGVSVLRRQDIKFYNHKVDDGNLCANTIYKSNSAEYLILGKRFSGTNTNQLFIGQILPQQPGSINLKPFLEPMKGIEINSVHKGKNKFWVSTIGSGVVGYPINPKTGMIVPRVETRLKADPKNINTLSSNGTGVVWEDPDQNLWVSVVGEGMDRVRSDIPYGTQGSVIRYGPLSKVSGTFYPENDKSFWTIIDLKGIEGIHLFHLPASPDGNDHVERAIEMKEKPFVMYKALDGSLLISTANTQKLYAATRQGDKYELRKIPLLKNTEVNAILEDNLGRIWTYGDDHIVCFDRKDSTTTVFDERDGIDHFRAIYAGWFHKTSEGIFVVVSPEGFTLFDPNTFHKAVRKITPVLTSLEINNNEATGSSLPVDDFTIASDISVLDELVLDYQHNNFSIEFSAMEMNSPEKNLYRHKLDGYDRDWIETDWKSRTAAYTNLDPGSYTMRVKASNHHGIWSDQERTLTVKILPPPWKSTWAYTGYGILFIGLLYAARKNIVQRERLKSNLKLAKVEQEKEHFELEKAKEVDRVKTSFFTNISHEFRTPLTLIKGPVETLLDRFKDDPDVIQRLKLVQRNSDLLLRLINQLLDLAKLESGSLKVEKSDGEIYSFTRAIASSFESFARQKNIRLLVEVPSKPQPANFDKDKLETILINLINNAIKFTPSNGTVTIAAEAGSDQEPTAIPIAIGSQQLILKVSDTGIGIPEAHQIKIFERFHQVSEAHKEVGTGIGLSLVKELVAQMNGTISVRSNPGEGSEFTVSLPIEIVEAEQKIAPVEYSTSYPLPETSNHERTTSNQQLATSNEEIEDGASTKPHVLVVEDNAELRAFIVDSLGNEFYFLEAGDGKQGLDIAAREVPDLIVSDVMMPEMDGITMTGKIKADIRTSHIPLILLTAKSSEDSKLSGLQSGADDYLTKPFNKQELLLKVRNGVKRQMKLREKLRAELMSTAPRVEVLSADEQFLIKVKEAILNQLSDEQLSVESLAEDIGMSRVQLYRKISGLTGMSVNEMIRKLRLHHAAQLLGQNWGPVSQVAYEVGFSNLSYFSKVFKEEFGTLPSEYVEKG